jgi:hypothetical protein
VKNYQAPALKCWARINHPLSRTTRSPARAGSDHFSGLVPSPEGLTILKSLLRGRIRGRKRVSATVRFLSRFAICAIIDRETIRWQVALGFWYPLRVPSRPHFTEVKIRQVRKVNSHVVSPMQEHAHSARLQKLFSGTPDGRVA